MLPEVSEKRVQSTGLTQYFAPFILPVPTEMRFKILIEYSKYLSFPNRMPIICCIR